MPLLAASPAFVGRASELASLQERLNAAIGGQGSAVLLAGEPGIGKTRLAEELAAAAVGHGARVLWGRCYEGDGAPAFWPWVQVLRALTSGADFGALRTRLGADAEPLAALIPDLRASDAAAGPPRSDSPEERFRLFAAVAAFLTITASATPLVLMLDDLHWADAPSLLLLEFLAREAATTRLLLVGTYRDTEARDDQPLGRTIGRLVRLPHALHLPLRGLGRADIAAVIAQISGTAASPSVTTAVSEATEGNPFYVGEIARHGVETDGADGALSIPPSLRAVISLRIGDLSPEAGHLLTLATVIGREFPLRVLEQATEGLRDGALEALEEAEAARVIEPSATVGSYRFAHALIRETLYDTIPGLRRARLHRQIGEVLEQIWGDDGDHLPQLAQHFFRAAFTVDAEKALTYARRTAERARRLLAYEESTRYYEMALHALERAAPTDRDSRVELLINLAEVRNAAGEYTAGQDAVVQAVGLARETGDGHALVRAVLTYEHRLDLGAVDTQWIALLEEAVRVAPEGEMAERARVTATLARSLTFVDADRSARLGREAIELAGAAGDASTRAFAQTYRMMSQLGAMEVGDYVEVATELVKIADESGDPDLRMQGHDRRALALFESGDLDGASAEVATMCRIGAEHRYLHNEWRWLAWEAMLAVVEGHFASAEGKIHAAFSAGERSGMPGAAQHASVQLYALRREQGGLGNLIPGLRGMLAQFQLPVWGAALAFAYAEIDQHDDARREFERLALRDFTDIPADMLRPCTLALLAQTCVALDDRARAARLYELLLPLRGRNIAVTLATSAYVGCASRDLAVLATLLERWEEADEHFAEALAMHERMRARPFLAHTRFEHGWMELARAAALGGADPARAEEGRARARALLDQARAAATELGMARLLVQIDRLDQRVLVGAGVETADARGFAQAASIASSVAGALPDGITIREMDVLRLLAGGYSNKQIADELFLSVATVRGHTISIYGKIGATGRAAAAAYALRHGITPPNGA